MFAAPLVKQPAPQGILGSSILKIESYIKSMNQELKKLGKMAKQHSFTKPAGMDTINKLCWLNAKTTTRQLLWWRQITTQWLGSTIQKNGKTPLARKIQKVGQIGKIFCKVNHFFFIVWMIKFKLSNIGMIKFQAWYLIKII